MASDHTKVQLATDNELVLLKSKDGEIFKVGKKAVLKFQFYADAYGLENPDQQDEPIPIDYESNILKLAIEWAEHHVNDPPVSLPITDPSSDDDDVVLRSDDIDEWDDTFLDIDKGLLFRLLGAASFLQADGLRIAGLKKVANMIKGKTPEELRMEFNIPEKKNEHNIPEDDDKPVETESKGQNIPEDDDKPVETESKGQNIPEDDGNPKKTKE